LGYTLISLDFSFPGSALAAWWKSPEKRSAPEYMQMSIALQEQLKILLTFYYFADVANYEDLDLPLRCWLTPTFRSALPSACRATI
jgi:hypothetical protein